VQPGTELKRMQKSAERKVPLIHLDDGGVGLRSQKLKTGSNKFTDFDVVSRELKSKIF